MAGEKHVLTLGGKGSSLSSAFVFKFSTYPRLLLKIDPSALARLSSSSSSSFKLQLYVPDYLTYVEARASFLLLLHKILIGGSSSAFAASQLLDILNEGAPISSIVIDCDNQEKLDMLRSQWPDITIHAICALLDYTATSLATIADAIAALSCDALEANASVAFSCFTDSGDGFYDKDRVSVARDLKVLLNGSTGKRQCDEVVSDIPIIHGSLRSLCKSIHSSTRVQLNSILFGHDASNNHLMRLICSLGDALLDLSKSSYLRARCCLGKLEEGNLSPSLLKFLCDTFPPFPQVWNPVPIMPSFCSVKGNVSPFHEIHNIFQTVRQILTWEATVSFISLELREQKPVQVQENTDAVTAKSEKKNKENEGNKKKVMGKGTNIFMQYLKDRLQLEKADISALGLNVALRFLAIFDLKDSRFEHLLQKVKDIVDTNESRRLPKTPKGTREFAKEEMPLIERIFPIAVDVFKRYGATALDTPLFELRETLSDKYGEDSKLYDLADQGGELCSLRYDLTVPFARYVAMNGIKSFRRYQIAKVYRRDNPACEFYQADFDIAGNETIGADFEVVQFVTALLDELNIGEYEIRLNHRKLLDGMLDICGVPSNKFRTVCSSIDKLDKQSIDDIKKELIEEKGLDAMTVEKIGSFVTLRGNPLSLLSELKKEGSEFLNNDLSSQALNDLEDLFECLKRARCVDRVVLDLSLARGLAYYTGVVFEAVFNGPTKVGSIAGGGRYDNLIGSYGSKTPVPAIGVCLGIERVFAIMEQNQKDSKQLIRASETQVLVSVMGDDKFLAVEMATMCRNAKLKAEYMPPNKRLDKHLAHARESGIPWMVIVGDCGVEKGMVKVKDMEAKADHMVPASRFLDELIKLMNTPRPSLPEKLPQMIVTK